MTRDRHRGGTRERAARFAVDRRNLDHALAMDHRPFSNPREHVMPGFRSLALSLVLVGLFAPTLLAHGGIYVPPPAPVPPGGGGGPEPGPGNATPPVPGGPTGPSAPATGAPTAPATPGPAAPSTGGPSTGGGLPIEADHGTWDYWWEYNKNGFLRLREVAAGHVAQTGSDHFYLGATRRDEARDRLRPSTEQLVREVLPALKQALDATGNRDIATACMVAMAKVGNDHPDFSLLDVFVPRLRDGDQEVRETAALAIGIAARGDERSLAMLEGLVLADGAGRAARGGDIEIRVRAFAAYGLGLTARRSADVATKARAFAALRSVVEDRRLADRNLKVAAITAIGLLDPNPRDYASTRLCEQALTTLEVYFRKDLGAGEQLIQAHCPTAIAKLIGRDHARSGYFRQLFTTELLTNDSRRSSNALSQSCALALGQLGMPCDGPDSLDAEVSRVLLQVARKHTDEPTRNFALMALAQVGGAENRTALLKEFDRANKAMRRPWCALALGVHAFSARERRPHEDADALIAQTLHDELQRAKEPGLTGALGIGLGLADAEDAAATMRERMCGNLAKEKMAGYLCIGLALMDDAESSETIQQVVRQAGRRPDLLVQAAIALGRLGDLRVAEQLVELMTSGEPNLVTLASMSAALGFIGDSRSIAPLVDMLRDQSLGSLPRAFAAAALGGIADRQPLPWNTPIGANINYRANVETLTNQATGVLDIL
jgi:hypothetical protein